jgi:hypothetical protein
MGCASQIQQRRPALRDEELGLGLLGHRIPVELFSIATTDGPLALTTYGQEITGAPTTAFYHADGNANVTALMYPNDQLAAKYLYSVPSSDFEGSL